tara:strand:- start:513 stop:977 length:465 start_codon:yes stop_codon:yes gene_type:complete
MIELIRTAEEKIFNEFLLLREELVEKHIQLGMEASGNWIRSLEVTKSPMSTKLIGEKYTEQLVYGRRPGTLPPVSVIKKWIEDKGITSNLSTTSLAWAIAMKIKRDGTKNYQKGGTDLVSSVITPQRIQKIINESGIQIALGIAPIFVNRFKKS